MRLTFIAHAKVYSQSSHRWQVQSGLQPAGEKSHTFIFPLLQYQTFGHSKGTENPFTLSLCQIQCIRYSSGEHYPMKILVSHYLLYIIYFFLKHRTLKKKMIA